ncbi:MAG: c-type cytochrome [Acidobacteriota bacterium]|nr:cytochrome c [Usitatibacter sp.]
MRLARAAILIVLLALCGCEQTFRNMYDQPRYKPLAASPLWSDGRASRPPVDGTVARSEGTFAGTTSGRMGTIAPAPTISALDTIREDVRTVIAGQASAHDTIKLPPITAALLARGRERYDIFCAPCHSIAGDGDGMIARRGFPHPPSFHIDRLRAASDTHFYAVISNGYGDMYSYATRVEPADRLAIIAYIRALQLAQHAPAAQLSDDDRSRLPAAPAGTPGGTR